MGFGTELKRVLKEKRISIKQLSQETGISLNTLYGITKRDTANVRADFIVKIAEALDVDINELVDSEGTNPLDYIEILSEYDYREKARLVAAASNISYLIGKTQTSIHELSAITGISEENLNSYLSGSELPSNRDYLAIANFFHIDVKKLKNEVILFDQENSSIAGNLLKSMSQDLSEDEQKELENFMQFIISKREKS